MAKTPPVTGTDDEFLWLEDIHGERPLEWVRRQNATTEARLDTEGFRRLQQQVTEVLDAPDRIPHVSKRGEWFYNFWRDAQHPRGVWRRTDWESYLAGSPAWEVLLDVDRLAEEEGTPWVFSGARLLRPDWDRALLRLSPDGGDAVAVREFDLTTRQFVPGAGQTGGGGRPTAGFSLPVAKTQASWIDRDHLLVGTVTDPDPDGGDVTRSSYASTLRVLARGQSLQEAETVFSVDHGHVAAFGGHDSTPGWERTVAIDAIDFYRSTTWLRDPDADGPRPGWRFVDVPEDAEVDVHRQWLVLFLKSGWDRNRVDGTTVHHPSGSLLVCTVAGFLEGTQDPVPAFVPGPEATLSSWTWTRSHLVLTVLRHVASSVLVLPQSRLGTPDAAASARPLVLQTPNPADPYLTLAAGAVDDEDQDCGDDLWITATGALTPPTLLRVSLPAVLPPASPTGPGRPDETGETGGPDAGTGAAGVVAGMVTVRTAPHRFDATGLTVRQFFAVSADCTRVPYFQVGPEDLKADGANPVLMDGYGGFLASKLPAYSGVYGLGWLTRVNEAGRSGVHVIANIRGGGEYGPDWHRAALRENRHRAYEDFAAVARDLVRRGVTDRAHLAAAGRSNGGLLMGVMATRYPELFGALSCGVPLLDLRRYTVLSAGHSWIAEYGDPDDAAQWEWIRTFSPYHLLLDEPVAGAAAGRDGAGDGTGHPDLLVWTATSDDRVGPVQARKMAARMQRLGVPNAWFHEDLEGGHAGASDNRQAAAMHARSLEFLWQSVGGGFRDPVGEPREAETADPAGLGRPAR